jgi:hypothetical protein
VSSENKATNEAALKTAIQAMKAALQEASLAQKLAAAKKQKAGAR